MAVIGKLHYLRGEYSEALHRYERSLRIAEELGDRAGVAGSIGQIGMVFMEIGQYEEAFTLLLKAMAMFPQLQSPDVGIAVNNFRTLRARWGERAFDAAWRAATNEDVPGWLEASDKDS
jgi:tetratricopeptide (TPR) repeat protein